jgi:Protein of unknown function (DUF1524)/Domain of unknown function (DUF4268)
LWKPIERRFQDADGNLDAERFSSFFRDFLMQDGAYVPPDQTFEAFQDRYASTDFDSPKVAAELKRAAEWYSIIACHEKDADPEVGAALASVQELGSSTTQSLLLKLFRLRHAGQITDSDLASSLRQLAGFILRRLVCGESSRGYSRLFVQANTELGQQPVENLLQYLVSRGFPDTARFTRDFVKFNLYNSRYGMTVLKAIERSHGHKEPADFKDAQVEHILPQRLSDAWRESLGQDAERVHQDWLHTPGNLTLSGYNPELSNKPFADKRQEYKKSNYVITRTLEDHETWGEVEIEPRGREMAERAAKIWPGPAAPIRRAEGESKPSKPVASTLRLRFWAGLRDHIAASGSTLKLQAPTDYHALRCGQIDVGLPLLAYAQPKKNEITICAWFGGKKAAQRFHEFQKHREAIEAEIGAKLHWTSNPKGDSFVVLYRNSADLSQENLWPSYFDWMRRTLEAYRHAFGSRLPKPEPGQTAETAGLTATQQLQLEYWTALAEMVKGRDGVIKSKKPQAQAWTTFSIGRTGFDLVASIHKAKRWIDVALVLYGTSAKPHFRAILENKPEIEAEIGESLIWREMPESIQSQVRLTRPDCDIADRANWPEQHEWLLAKLETFHKVLAARIKVLDVANDDPGPSSDHASLS